MLELIATINDRPLHNSMLLPKLKTHLILPDHLILDSVLFLGPLISRWEINEFENC